jgi:hypothetical protein
MVLGAKLVGFKVYLSLPLANSQRLGDAPQSFRQNIIPTPELCYRRSSTHHVSL